MWSFGRSEPGPQKGSDLPCPLLPFPEQKKIPVAVFCVVHVVSYRCQKAFYYCHRYYESNLHSPTCHCLNQKSMLGMVIWKGTCMHNFTHIQSIKPNVPHKQYIFTHLTWVFRLNVQIHIYHFFKRKISPSLTLQGGYTQHPFPST